MKRDDITARRGESGAGRVRRNIEERTDTKEREKKEKKRRQKSSEGEQGKSAVAAG